MLDDENFLELDARKEIYECIKKSPGLHFREIQRRTKIPTGSLEYHLHFLHKHGLLRTEKRGGFLLYYPTDQAFGEEEKSLLNLLRQEKIRHILIYIMDHKISSASDIAAELKISPSNLSWYLNLLLQKNIISVKKRGRFRFYSIKNKEKIITCLITYKSSFLDKIVDSFIETWEE
jgi:predicted transcriptional regulator